MKLTNAFTYKRLSATEPGELCRFPYASGSALGLTFATSEKEIVVGVLSFNFELSEGMRRFQPPFLARLPTRTSCLSYGLDWVLETCSGSEMLIDSRSHTERSGAIHITAGGVILTVRSQDDFMAGPSGFNLTSNELGPTPSHEGAACLSWAIWASEGDRLLPSGTPLMKFSTAANNS